MLLFELMNKSLPVDEVHNDEHEVTYRFYLPDGRIYIIEYNKLSDNPATWELTFHDSSDSSVEQYKLTNKGSEIPIFVTVFTNLGEFVKTHPDDVIFFTADDAKRASVYNKFAKRVVPYIQTDMSPEGKTQFYIGKPEHVQQYMKIIAGDF